MDSNWLWDDVPLWDDVLFTDSSASSPKANFPKKVKSNYCKNLCTFVNQATLPKLKKKQPIQRMML